MTMQQIVREQAQKAKQAAIALAMFSEQEKNKILLTMAAALINEQERILAANALDMKAGREKGMRLIDRELRMPRMDQISHQRTHRRGVIPEILDPKTVGNLQEVIHRDAGQQ